MPDIRELFAEGGALSRALHDYRPRQEQVEMAQRVQEVLAKGGGQCVLEAGTGVGKTFAYLAPIILSGKTALISTGARALQDQLLLKDIPRLTSALERKTSVAVLKGRANYICKKAVEENSHSLDLKDDSSDWEKIRLFAGSSSEGDLRGLTDVPSDSPLLGRAISTRESCNTRGCPHFDSCFLYQARKRAREADIVIVNHHLFLSDVRLRDEGVAEILPQRDVVLFDEAHQLPQLAPQFFGEQVSGAHLSRLLAQVERAAKRMKPKDDGLLAAARAVGDVLEQWKEASNAYTEKSGTTEAAPMLADAQWVQMTKALAHELMQLARTLMQKPGDDEVLPKIAERMLADCSTLTDWLLEEDAAAAAPPADADEYADDDDAAAAAAAAMMDGEEGEEEEDPIVRWASADESSGNLTLHSAPMTGRNLFRRQWKEQPTLFFTSATLSVGGDFEDFCEAAGLDSADTHCWNSPYDFAKRTLLYLPSGMPAPAGDSTEAHTEAVVKAALPLVIANGGRAFMLFTSWRALRQAHALLQPLLQKEDIATLKQGDVSNDELLQRFRSEPRAVLVGSKSFWQGVDVRGEGLSLVVVDKVPFTPPSDPLLKARDDWREKRGESAFMRNQLPAAVLLMKQVAGRLIRDYDDYGIFMIGDPRILKKSYGRKILSALPPMPQCRNAAQAEEFLRRWGARRARANEAADADDSGDEFDDLEF